MTDVSASDPASGLAEEPLPTPPPALLARLRELGIAFDWHSHPPYRTVEEAQALRGDVPGGHCKNLFLKDKKGRYWLVVALEEAVVRLNQFDKTIGSARLTFASPERLWEVLGVRPGSVTPFALINDRARQVTVVLQKRMLDRDPVHYHPLVNTETVALAAAGLLAFIRSCGHEPMIVDFG
jgi:Ala-tRNA(Pro) deacylase